MRYTVKRSYINVLGRLWMPNCAASIRQTLSQYDIDNMRDDSGKITRDSVEQWVMTHTGDFSSITDFEADIEDGDENIVIPWESEENEMAYLDTLGDME